MSKTEQVQAQFWQTQTWINGERDKAESMVGKLPKQDPCAVRTYVLKDMQRQIEAMWQRIEKILNAPDA
jgi:hypothetical protein